MIVMYWREDVTSFTPTCMCIRVMFGVVVPTFDRFIDTKYLTNNILVEVRNDIV